MATKDLQSFERLFDGGHASKYQVELAERYVMDLNLQLIDNSNHLTGIKRSIERTKDEMKNYQNSYRHGLQKEFVATKESLVVAASSLRTAQNEVLKTKIRATSRGVIQGLSNKVRGSVVSTGQTVAEIIQDRGDFIIAEGLLPPHKIAFFAHRTGGRLEDYNNTNVDDLFEVIIRADRSAIGKRCPDLKGYVFYVSPIPGGDRSVGYGYHIRSLAVVDPKALEVCKTIISAGSPVEIMVKTYSRTPIAYIFDGLTRGMSGMFRD